MKTLFQPIRRRAVLQMLAGASGLARGVAWASSEDPFLAIERRSGGQIGVAAFNVRTGAALTYRSDERFAMCSTFKWLLGGLILQRVDRGIEDLERRLPFDSSDLVFHSPVTEAHADGRGMSVGDLCEATIKTSDNTAANILMETLGGPSGFTQSLREMGDRVTRLDRLEPYLNENAPGDLRDTTTPMAMANLMREILFGTRLSDGSKDMLHDWMIGASTGLDRLRAGFPEGWRGGDKTGTSSNRANNDVGSALPPAGFAGDAIIIASYTNVPDPLDGAANAVHSEIARHVIGRLS